MKRVISASRRTDIPAFYLKWFMNALKCGEISVKNPIFKKNKTIVDLRPESVEWIVCWSRNYWQFLRNHSFFENYRLFFHFTIISHHPMLEKVEIPFNESLNQMEGIVRHFDANNIIWRFDPLVFWRENSELKTNFNKREFTFLCREMESFGVSNCYFSVVTPYKKFIKRWKKNYPHFELLAQVTSLQQKVLQEMKDISLSHDIQLYSCCNNRLVDNQIQQGHCISGSVLNQINHYKTVSEAKSPTRLDCGCTRSIDIGDYLEQPCHFGCIYCYANPVWK